MDKSLFADYQAAIDKHKADLEKENKPKAAQVPIQMPEQLPVQQREVVESYKLAFGRNAYGLYAQRAKLVLIEALQDHIEGLTLKDGGCVKYDTKVDEDLFGERTIEIDIRRICPDGVTNYTEVRNQLEEMMSLHFEYETEETWELVNFFQKVIVKKGSWKATFLTTKAIWEVFMDFSKGYRKVELGTAMKFRSVYALRFYEKVVGQNTPITYTIDELRAMFKLEKKYKLNKDFIKKVVQAAKDELDEISPWSFDYTQNYKADGPGRPSLFSVTITPVHQMKNEGGMESSYLRKNLSPSGYLCKESLDYLKHTLGFTTRELTNNAVLFEAAEKSLDLPTFLRKIAPRAVRAWKPHGYVINAIKKELREKAKIVV